MLSKLRQKHPAIFDLLTKIISWENLLAFLLALALIAIYITTAADAPIWLYQGF